ncbi:hypothetical protein ACFLXC_01915 [Chloroflexota bacterium]
MASISAPESSTDLPSENDTRYDIVKGGINGQERLHTGADHQQARVLIEQWRKEYNQVRPPQYSLIPSTGA